MGTKQFAVFGSVVEFGERYRVTIEEFDTEAEAEANVERIEKANQNNSFYDYVFVDEV